MTDELVSIRIRLAGGKEAAGELKLISTAEKEVGASALAAGTASARGASGISRVLGRMRGAWTAVKRVAKFAAVGAAAAALGIFAYGKKAVTTTDNLAKATSGLHKTMGFSYEKASALLSLFQVRGAEPAKVGMAFKTLANQLRSAATGSESAIGIFRKLGLSQDEVQKALGNSDYAITRVSRGFENLPPGMAKASLAAKLFGRGWESIFPLLREGPKAMQEQIDKAKEFGAVLDGQAVTGAMDMVEAQREMQLASIGWQITFATKIEPTIVKIVRGIAQFTNGMRTGTGAGGKFAAIMRVTGQVLTWSYNAIKVGIVWLVAASKATAAWATGAAQAVSGGFSAFVNWIVNAYNNVKGFVSSLIPVKIALAWMKVAFTVVSAVVHRFAEYFGPPLKVALYIAGAAIKYVWASLKTMGRIFADVVGIVSNLLRGKWGAAWRDAKKLVGDVIGGVLGRLGELLSFLGGLPGKILEAMKGVGKAIVAPFIWAFEKIKWVKEQIDKITGALNGSGATPTHHGPLSPESKPGEGPGSGIGGRGPHFHDPLAPDPIEPRIRIPGRTSNRMRGDHPAAGASSRSRGTLPEARGRPAEGRARPAGGRRRTLMQPVQFTVDRRVLAEGIVEIHEDDEARE